MFEIKLLRKKKCKSCGLVFQPLRQLQATCSSPCAIIHGRETQRKKEAKAHREKKAQLKTIPQLKREAQQACNAYVRYRDKDLPCICCGLPLTNNFTDGIGGLYDAGHYRSVGSAPHLRFDERNIHAQRKSCNQWGSGRAVDYRLGLIARFDVQYVEAIEADQTPKKYTRDDLIAIKKYYQAKLKALKAEG